MVNGISYYTPNDLKQEAKNNATHNRCPECGRKLKLQKYELAVHAQSSVLHVHGICPFHNGTDDKQIITLLDTVRL